MKRTLLLALVVLVSPALANVYTGPGFAITDNGTFTSNIVVPDSFTINQISVELDALTHTWIGDLIATISDGTTSVDLFNRVGRTGGSGAGDSSNCGADYIFYDGAIGDLWATAASGDSSFVIPAGAYFPTTVDGALSSLNAAYVGTNSMKTWTLTISDNAGGDVGALTEWELTLLPEPASFVLLGLGVLLRRR